MRRRRTPALFLIRVAGRFLRGMPSSPAPWRSGCPNRCKEPFLRTFWPMKTVGLLLFLVVSASTSVVAAPFQNLNFEQANTNSVGFSNPLAPLDLFGPSTDLLPGWQMSRGTNLLTSIGFNRISLAFVDIGGVSLNSQDPIEGKFSLFVRVPGGLGVQEPFSLVQRGDIPSDAHLPASSLYCQH